MSSGARPGVADRIPDRHDWDARFRLWAGLLGYVVGRRYGQIWVVLSDIGVLAESNLVAVRHGVSAAGRTRLSGDPTSM